MKSVFRIGYLIRQVLTPALMLVLAVFFIYLGNPIKGEVYYVFAGVMGIGCVISVIRFMGWNYFVIELTEEELKVIYPFAGRGIKREYTSIKKIRGYRKTLEGEGLVLRTKGGGGFSEFRTVELHFKDGLEISFSEDHYENFAELRGFIMEKREEE